MHFSGYVNSLTLHQRKVYENKLLKIGSADPYEISYNECEESPSVWPQITHGDIVHFLVYSTNSVTLEQMKSFKSLESHNYFTSGWVNKKVLSKKISDSQVILLGEVKHSQALKAKPLKVWILLNYDGHVVTAHCSCMAGFGESCSHIGGLLFAVEYRVNRINSKSCTEGANKWLPPQVKDSPFLRIKDIDFSSAKSKKRKMDDLSFHVGECDKSDNVINNIPKPSDDEMNSFLQNVASTGVPAAILSVTSNFSDSFIRDNIKKDSLNLSNLFKEEYFRLGWEDLIHHCKRLLSSDIFSISETACANVELKTKDQVKSKDWFKYSVGRVTASIMKAVCHTNPKAPSTSLISKICYPPKSFFSKYTAWGCAHEKEALALYVSNRKKYHEEFAVTNSGFHIHKEFSYIGATPDGLVSCKCCGQGVCEIKCPYCSKDQMIQDAALRKNSCLMSDSLSNIQLDKSHAYYYQVQTQLFACDVEYWDFVVWTNEDIYIERIYPDLMFWDSLVEKSSDFYLRCILPELTGKWYSKKM